MKNRSSIWFWLLIAAVPVCLTLLTYSDTFRTQFNSATNWAKDIIASNPATGALVFFLFAMVSAMLAFASSAVLVPAANLVWGKLVTFLLLWSGWIAGAVAAYGIGRLSRPLLNFLGYRATLEKYQQYISRRTKFWMVLLFCFAVPSEIPGYVLGGTRYSVSRFLLAIAVSEAVYALGLVFAGEKLLSAKRADLLLIAGILIAIGAGAALLFRKLRKRRSMA